MHRSHLLVGIDEKGKNARIEDILRPRQMIMCQVTKNPIGAKGARSVPRAPA